MGGLGVKVHLDPAAGDSKHFFFPHTHHMSLRSPGAPERITAALQKMIKQKRRTGSYQL